MALLAAAMDLGLGAGQGRWEICLGGRMGDGRSRHRNVREGHQSWCNI
jgi:hypothetical protein